MLCFQIGNKASVLFLFAYFDTAVGTEVAGRHAGFEGEEMLVGIIRILAGISSS